MARKTKPTRPAAPERLAATDSLSNLAASLGGGKDKAAADAFFLACLPRDQIEAMYRGDWLARKIVELRILRGERSALDEGAPLLVVSQFTLYGDTRKGRRPSWGAAAPGPVAEPLVDAFVTTVRGYGLDVATGRFGADMAVELVNDGPVTLILEA